MAAGFLRTKRSAPTEPSTRPGEAPRLRPFAPVRIPADPAAGGAKPGHRDDIQGLRAVAVLLVVLWHAGVGFVRGGYVGVDVFFVLSGFLITGLLIAGAERRGYVSLREFYARRAKRILPAAALTLVVTDFAAVHLMNFVRARQAVQDSVWAAFFAANVQFAHRGTDYFAQSMPPSPIQHYWSLAVEEQFYLVWPVLLAAVLAGVGLHRRRARRGEPAPLSSPARVRLGIVIAVAGGASLAWSILETHRSPTGAYFSTLTRVWELALGAALAIGASAFGGLTNRTRAVLGWAGVAAICGAAVGFSEATAFPGSVALVPTIGTAMVIAAGIGDERSRGGVGGLLGRSPMRYVGDRSYAVYLWHWPVLLIAAAYAGHALPVGTSLALVAGAFALSVASFRLVENPVRHARLHRPVSTSAVLWGTSVGLVLVVAAFNLQTIANANGGGGVARPGDLPTLAGSTPTPGTTGTDPARTDPADPTGTAIPAVVAAVRAAEDGSPIPEALIPPLGSLLEDRYPTIPDCWELREDPTWLDRCTLNPGGVTGTIALIGDSHARQWLPAVMWMARRDGWSVVPLLHMGCWPASYEAGGECQSYIAWAEQQVRDLHPEVVLIGGELRFQGAESIGQTVAGIGDLVAAVGPDAGRVVVIGDPPARGFQPVDCLLARGATLENCTWSLQSNQLSVYAAAERAAIGGGASFLDTMGWFCSDDRCPTVVGRTVTFRENDHITRSYATELRQLFRTAFVGVVSVPL